MSTPAPALPTISRYCLNWSDGGLQAYLAAQLKGKPVQVRAKVVKFNAGIMGKNWIHLRADKNFGAGYVYPVMVEDATLQP